MKKVGIALLGLGTVGGGTYRILKTNHDEILKNNGIDVRIIHILERDAAKVEALGIDPAIVSCDIENIVKNDEISIVAEFFGGIEPAKSFLIRCLEAGKSIVTANKELFAKHWDELCRAAKKGKAGLYFEASCVGGVPVIRTLTDSMQGNRILSMKGIVNGTTNFILSKMADESAEYGDVLREAQRLGYAEANPSADVDGYDSMYKLSILSTLAFHRRVPIEFVYREGIANISKIDIAFGKEFGYTLKLLAIGKQRENGKIEARVHPAFIRCDHPLASVKGSFNAVHIEGDNVGDVMLYGRGAGDLPTGSAIVSDIVYAARQKSPKNDYYGRAKPVPAAFATDFSSEYFVRMTVSDRAGVLAKIAEQFGKFGISIATMVQRGMGDGTANIIFMIHKTEESKIKRAIKGIEALNPVVSIDSLIRVEN